ncbi:hypothetical protein B6D60_08150 [candidate division KSB1 bacterium 4484_87]|nr:MAG: hypothetical protein B6D60_08150 [candidate division KSB1 bacterium 4484_87]
MICAFFATHATVRISPSRELYPQCRVLLVDYFKDKSMIFRVVKVHYLLWLFFPMLSMSQTLSPENNVAIFQQLADDIVREVVSEVGLDTTHSVVIQSRSENRSGNWLIENAFIRCFLSKKISVQMNAQDSGENSFLFEYFISELKVDYEKVPSKKLTRHLTLNLDVRVLRGAGKSLVLFKKYSKSFQDIIPSNAVKQVESGRYPFTHGNLPENRNWKKWISPAVILLSTGVVIYSFFALRSK